MHAYIHTSPITIVQRKIVYHERLKNKESLS